MTAFGSVVADLHLAVDEQFDRSELDRSRWVPFYLPHWAGRKRSRARYRLTGRDIELYIADDQPEWRPDIEPNLRVSSLQTGCFSGPVGSTIGQHRTDDRLTVVEAQPISRLITPTFGAIEMRARWSAHPDCMVALWMIGFEDRPERSAEICICEIFGSEVAADGALVGVGLHPFGDPTIVEDFEKIRVDVDVAEFHEYSAVWTPGDVAFFVDGEPIKRSDQAPQYPMQLMLDIYDFGDGSDDRRSPSSSPFVVDSIRIYEASNGP